MWCVLLLPVGVIQPVTFHPAMTKVQKYTGGSFHDYGVPNKIKAIQEIRRRRGGLGA